MTDINIHADTFEVIFEKFQAKIDGLQDTIDNIGYATYEEVFMAEQDQIDFELQNEYTTNNIALEVYVDNVKQIKGQGFIETSSRSFRITEPLDYNQMVYVKYFEVMTKPRIEYIDDKPIEED